MSVEQNVNSRISNHDITPTYYFICIRKELVKVRNAVGLVGAILFSNKSADVHFRMSGFLTLFSLMNAEELALPSIQEIFRSHGYDLQPIYINSLKDLYNRVVFSHSETRVAFKNLLKTYEIVSLSPSHSRTCIYLKGDWHTQLKNIPSLDYPFDYTIAFCGIIYLFALKRFEKSYMNQKMISALHAFAKSLRLSESFGIFTFLPSKATCVQLQDTLHKMLSVRKHVFLVIRDKYYKIIDKWSPMFDVLFQFLKYTDMHTLRLVNKYIFVDNPELIENPLLQSEIQALCSSLAFIQEQKIDTVDLPYIKLLYDSSVTGHFATSRYKNLAYLATSFNFGNILENNSIYKYVGTRERAELGRLAVEIAMKTKSRKPEDVFLTNQGCLARFKDLLDVLADPFTGEDISNASKLRT